MAVKLYDVDDTEEVARVLFSPTMANEGRISRNAFFLEKLKSGKWESYLSVWRTKFRIPSKENVTFPPRNPDDELYGYATIMVETIHNQDILGCIARVKGNSKDCNHYHVGIYYTLNAEPVVGECDDPGFMALTKALANNATLHIFRKLE